MHPPNIHTADNASITLIVFIWIAPFLPSPTQQRPVKFLNICNNMLRDWITKFDVAQPHRRFREIACIRDAREIFQLLQVRAWGSYPFPE
jgi:hypothetical protein